LGVVFQLSFRLQDGLADINFTPDFSSKSVSVYVRNNVAKDRVTSHT